MIWILDDSTLPILATCVPSFLFPGARSFLRIQFISVFFPRILMQLTDSAWLTMATFLFLKKKLCSLLGWNVSSFRPMLSTNWTVRWKKQWWYLVPCVNLYQLDIADGSWDWWGKVEVTRAEKGHQKNTMSIRILETYGQGVDGGTWSDKIIYYITFWFNIRFAVSVSSLESVVVKASGSGWEKIGYCCKLQRIMVGWLAWGRKVQQMKRELFLYEINKEFV